MGDYQKALFYFKKCLQQKGVSNELAGFIHVELYKLFILLGDEKNALEIMTKSVKFMESFPLCSYYIGRVFFDKKDFSNAKEFFKFFIEKNKNKKYFNPVPIKTEESAKYFLALSYLFTGERKMALKIANKLIKKNPENQNYIRLKKLLEQN